MKNGCKRTGFAQMCRDLRKPGTLATEEARRRRRNRNSKRRRRDASEK